MNPSPRYRAALAALMLSLFLCPAALAQRLPAEPASHAPHAKKPALFCGTDFTRLRAHAARDALGEDRSAARMAAARLAQANGQPPEIGDEKRFRVELGGPWYTFVLKDKSALHYVWVEENEIGDVTDDMIAALHTALVERTPEGSYNPNQGFLANL